MVHYCSYYYYVTGTTCVTFRIVYMCTADRRFSRAVSRKVCSRAGCGNTVKHTTRKFFKLLTKIPLFARRPSAGFPASQPFSTSSSNVATTATVIPHCTQVLCRNHRRPSIRPREHANVPRDVSSLPSIRNNVRYAFSTNPSGHRALYRSIAVDDSVIYFLFRVFFCFSVVCLFFFLRTIFYTINTITVSGSRRAENCQESFGRTRRVRTRRPAVVYVNTRFFFLTAVINLRDCVS